MQAGGISQVLNCIFYIETNAVAVPIKPSERSHPVSENRREEEWKNDTAVVLDNKDGRTTTLYQQDEHLRVYMYICFSLC